MSARRIVPWEWKKWTVVTRDGVDVCAFSTWKEAAPERDRCAAADPTHKWEIHQTRIMPDFVVEMRDDAIFAAAEEYCGRIRIGACHA